MMPKKPDNLSPDMRVSPFPLNAKMRWDIISVSRPDAEHVYVTHSDGQGDGILDHLTVWRLLRAGWEPFAVDNSVIYLRKLVPMEDETK